MSTHTRTLHLIAKRQQDYLAHTLNDLVRKFQRKPPSLFHKATGSSNWRRPRLERNLTAEANKHIVEILGQLQQSSH